MKPVVFMTPPVIFLDIDGVMCTFNEYNRNRNKLWQKHEEAKELRLPYEFNPVCVKILNEILEVTKADIVLSSDWRTHWDLQALGNIFKYNKVIKVPMDVTDVFPTSFSYLEKNRAHEIDIYRQKHNLENYVIVDDLDLLPFVPKDRFVQTREQEGLKQSNVKQKILKILKNEQK